MQLKLFAVAVSSLAITQAASLPNNSIAEVTDDLPPNLLAEAHADAESDYSDDDMDDFAETYADEDHEAPSFLSESRADAEFSEPVDKYADPDLYAQAYAAAFGDEEAAAMLAQTEEGFLGNIGDQAISAVDSCTAFTSAWECVSSPVGCIYRDTAHECTKL